MKQLVLTLIVMVSFNVSACRVPTILNSDFAQNADKVLIGRIVAMAADKPEECLKPQASRIDNNLVCIIGGTEFEFRIVASEYLKGNGEKTQTYRIATCGVELPQLLSETIVAIKGGVVRIISDNQNAFRAMKESLTRK